MEIEADEGSKQLMKMLNRAIGEFTHEIPMSVEQIVVCLGYMTGRAIGHIEGRNARRAIKACCEANLERGIDHTIAANGTPAIIMPLKAAH